MGIEPVVLREAFFWGSGVSWLERIKKRRIEPLVVWKVKMSNGTEQWSSDLLSEEELDFAFRYIYGMAVVFLKEKKSMFLLPDAFEEKLMTEREAVKNVEPSLRKLWLECVAFSRLGRLGELLEFFINNGKELEKNKKEGQAVCNDWEKSQRNILELQEKLSWEGKEWEWFWVEDAKQFSKAIKAECKELIELLVKKEDGGSKKSQVLLSVELARNQMREEVMEFLKQRSGGSEEVLEVKIKELEAIGQNAIVFFEGDLTKIGKRVERRLEGPKTRWQRGVDWLQKWIYPIVPAAVVGVVGFLNQCNGGVPCP